MKVLNGKKNSKEFVHMLNWEQTEKGYSIKLASILKRTLQVTRSGGSHSCWSSNSRWWPSTSPWCCGDTSWSLSLSLNEILNKVV